MIKAYFTEINPTKEQSIKINQTIGVMKIYLQFIYWTK